jgi:uncharacterized protein (TIGR03084 family)
MTADVVIALDAQRRELASVLAGADADGLRRPSRCEGWSVADVLVHLAQTDELAVATLDGRFDEAARRLLRSVEPGDDVDDWAAAAVAGQPMDPEAALERWAVAAQAQVDAFARADLSGRVPWVAGELAARTLASTRLTECWIHTLDVASAFGPPPPPTARLWHTCRLAWRTLPYAFARAGTELTGPVRFELDGPDGARWSFGAAEADAAGEPGTVVRGSAVALCEVAGRRLDGPASALVATGPDAASVLALVRTFA